MIIAIDEAIPYWEAAFSGLGDIHLFSGRTPEKNTLLNADALVVRSITPVHEPLLDGSKVRFVASASAGIDHIDLKYLQDREIGFRHAPGCNANTVSEYIATALCVFADRRGWTLGGKSLAVIGAGHVGTHVAQKAKALEMKVLLCDPPLRDQTANFQYRDYQEVLEADFISFHVPLEKAGAYPTLHMLHREILNQLSTHQVIINTSRGAVIDNKDLKAAVLKKQIEGAILDVWEKEPQIDYSLLDRIDIGTPHIAGSSLDGKIRATEMVCAALHEFFQIPSPWNGEPLFTKPKIISPDKTHTGQAAVLSVLLKAYNILDDDGNLRKLGSVGSTEEANAGFDRLRSSYAFRPEFRHFIVVLDEQRIQLASIFKALGFQVRQGAVL